MATLRAPIAMSHPKPNPQEKPGLHPRNRHRLGYDFARLTRSCPELAPFVRPSPAGEPSIDFADPRAVLALNRALLIADYGLETWSLPEGYLCPPIPGRADYLHAMADLIAGDGPVPRGDAIRVLDIGIGASCVYPILGCADYGWSFVGTDIDAASLHAARRLVDGNRLLRGHVDLRLQPSANSIFAGVVKPGERFAFCICNPPFHASAEDAAAGSLRKVRNLAGRTLPRDAKARLNFGGRINELVTPGGETGFVTRMIAESARLPALCGWYSCLVSKSENLPAIESALQTEKVSETRILPLAQGQKRSRIVAWRF